MNATTTDRAKLIELLSSMLNEAADVGLGVSTDNDRMSISLSVPARAIHDNAKLRALAAFIGQDIA